MNYKRTAVICTVLLIGLMAFTGCGDESSKSVANKLIGTWTLESWEPGDHMPEGMEMIMTFKNDNTCTIVMTYDGDTYNQTANYSTSGSVLTFEVGGVYSNVNYSISGSAIAGYVLVIEDDDSTMIFVR